MHPKKWGFWVAYDQPDRNLNLGTTSIAKIFKLVIQTYNKKMSSLLVKSCLPILWRLHNSVILLHSQTKKQHCITHQNATIKWGGGVFPWKWSIMWDKVYGFLIILRKLLRNLVKRKCFFNSECHVSSFHWCYKTFFEVVKGVISSPNNHTWCMALHITTPNYKSM